MKVNLTVSLLFGATLILLAACNWNRTEKAQQQNMHPDQIHLLLSAGLYREIKTITKIQMVTC